jgi:hypothetical protein
MHDRRQTVVWRFGRLLGPAVVALLACASTARADTPRQPTVNPAPPGAARWWGPLRVGGRMGGRLVALQAPVRPRAARRSSIVAGRASRRSVSTAPAAAGGARLGQACRSDAQCVESGTICEKQRCEKIRRTINILWLFYRSGDRRYTSVLGLYHHRKGTPGLRILAPFYFHVWSKLSETRVILPPLFVQHRDRLHGRTDTFVLNFHHHRSPGAVGFNVWPFLFARSYGKQGFSFSLVPLVHYKRRGRAWSMYFLLFPPWAPPRSTGP